MRDADAIETYLRELAAALRRAGRPTEPLVDEARAHLYEDAAQIAGREGCGDAEAARRAVDRFGAVTDVVAASRKHARTAAANVARVASLLALGLMLYATLTDLVRAHEHTWIGWPFTGEQILMVPWLLLLAELAVVTLYQWRALSGGVAPRVLTTVLQLNAALSGVLLAISFITASLSARGWVNVGVYGALSLVPPVWLFICVQSVAALRALGRERMAVRHG
jgi:hypothetical protein